MSKFGFKFYVAFIFLVAPCLFFSQSANGVDSTSNTQVNQLPKEPSWLNVKIKSGEAIKGFVHYDATTGFVSVLSYTKTRTRRLDWIHPSIIVSWQALDGPQGNNAIRTLPFTFPLAIQIQSTDGKTVQGSMDSFKNQPYFDISLKDSQAPTQIYFDMIIHAVLVESSHSQTGKRKSEKINQIRETFYTTIPLVDKQSPLLALPDTRAKVIIETTLGHQLTGVLRSWDESWAEFNVERIGPFQFAPPHLMLIHRSTIRSIILKDAGHP